MNTTWSSRTLDPALVSGLMKLASQERSKQDMWGNGFHWVLLNRTADLPVAAELLANHGARLCTVTALHRELSELTLYMAYHFDVHGYTVTVTVVLDTETKSVPTITPWFRNAEWNERECTELYGVHVEGAVRSDRLFLDPAKDEGILNEIIPLTVMMNGACTKDLWERVMLMNKDLPVTSPEAPATESTR